MLLCLFLWQLYCWKMMKKEAAPILTQPQRLMDNLFGQLSSCHYYGEKKSVKLRKKTWQLIGE